MKRKEVRIMVSRISGCSIQVDAHPDAGCERAMLAWAPIARPEVTVWGQECLDGLFRKMQWEGMAKTFRVPSS